MLKFSTTPSTSLTEPFTRLHGTTLVLHTLALGALSLVLSSAAVAATPPLLAEIPAQSAPLNQIYSFNLTPYARATDGDTITFLVNDLPAGLSANKNTGLISGTPSATGSYTVGVRARDKDGDSPKQKFILKVGTPPVLDSIPDQDGRK
ncbi:MAG: Ig domain-containing protein, partial [Halothiobacillaceae bacterium]|nr:Ig domain-containing protein [Halothiobacillaceae bacterium]